MENDKARDLTRRQTQRELTLGYKAVIAEKEGSRAAAYQAKVAEDGCVSLDDLCMISTTSHKNPRTEQTPTVSHEGQRGSFWLVGQSNEVVVEWSRSGRLCQASQANARIRTDPGKVSGVVAEFAGSSFWQAPVEQTPDACTKLSGRDEVLSITLSLIIKVIPFAQMSKLVIL